MATSQATVIRSTGRALEKWLTLAQAAKLAGVSRSGFDLIASRGDEIPFVWLDGIRYFHTEDVQAWAEARRQNERD